MIIDKIIFFGQLSLYVYFYCTSGCVQMFTGHCVPCSEFLLLFSVSLTVLSHHNCTEIQVLRQAFWPKAAQKFGTYNVAGGYTKVNNNSGEGEQVPDAFGLMDPATQML